MTNAEMDPIQVQDTPMLLKRALSPGFELFGQRSIEATDRAGPRSTSHEGLSDFANLVGARASHEHLRQPFCDVWFIATVTFKRLGVELTFPISGHFEILEPTSRGHQITGVGAVAIAFALGTTLSPGRFNELIEFFTHHGFYHYANRALGQTTQV